MFDSLVYRTPKFSTKPVHLLAFFMWKCTDSSVGVCLVFFYSKICPILEQEDVESKLMPHGYAAMDMEETTSKSLIVLVLPKN